MKKTIILLAALIISFSAFSQQRTRSFMGWHLAKDAPAKLNELKLNLPTTIFLSYPEVSYERILNEDISVGASVGVALQDDRYPVKFAFNPYFRWFFGGSSNNLQKYGAGFFIEANGALLSTNYNFRNNPTTYVNENGERIYIGGDIESNSLGAGLGLALGWKYLSKNNWIGEIYFGGGRDFANDGAYPRMGISIGKRF